MFITYRWLGTRWRRSPPVPHPVSAIVPVEPTRVRVPPEYLPLYSYLEHRYAAVVVLTFEQIEALLGGSLPLPASTEREWWTGDAAHLHPHSAAWAATGRTATPNLSARTVTFERAA
jgi:hypothetical protein